MLLVLVSGLVSGGRSVRNDCGGNGNFDIRNYNRVGSSSNGCVRIKTSIGNYGECSGVCQDWYSSW